MQMSEPIISRYLHAKGTKLGLPISGTFELTPRCNFACKMCYVRLSDKEACAIGAELSTQQWISLGEQVQKVGTVYLLLTGGEPTLRPDFAEIYTALKKMGFILSINTNGYLLSGELRELLLQDPPNRLNITLYGTDNETYQRLCGVPAFDRIMENADALKKGGINVKFNISLTPDNADELPQLIQTARTLGANVQATSYMFPPRRRGEAYCKQDNRLSAEQAGRYQAAYQRLMLLPQQLAQRKQKLEAGLRPEAMEEDDCDGTIGHQMYCRAGKTCYWITWDGRMLPCGQMITPSIPLLPQGFDAAWQQVREQAAQIRLPAKCASCEKSCACPACAAMCYAETGAFDEVPTYLCRMTDAYLTEILKQGEGGTNEDQA